MNGKENAGDRGGQDSAMHLVQSSYTQSKQNRTKHTKKNNNTHTEHIIKTDDVCPKKGYGYGFDMLYNKMYPDSER